MADRISSLFVEFRASTDKFNSDLKALNREVREFEKILKPSKELLGTIGTVATTAGAAFAVVGVAVAAAAAAIGVAVKAAAEYADAIRDASIQTGLTTQNMAALKYAAEQNGSTFEELSVGLKFLAKNFTEATTSGGQQLKAFNSIGISSKELKAANGDLNAVLRLVMDRFKEMPDGAAKTTAMVDLLGKSGQKLTEFMSQGAKGLDDASEKTRKFGTDVADGGKAADDFRDALNDLDQAILGIKVSIGRELIPGLTELIRKVSDATIGLRPLASSIGELALQATKFLSVTLGSFTGGNNLAVFAENAKKPIVDLTKVTVDLTNGVISLGESFKALDEAGESKRIKEATELREKQLDAMYRAIGMSKRLADATIADMEREAAARQAYSDLLRRYEQDDEKAIIEAIGHLQTLDKFWSEERAKFDKETKDSLDDQTRDLNVTLQQQQAAVKDSIKKLDDAQKEAAKANERIWEQATANITSDFIKAFSDVIFHAKGFMAGMKELALTTAESMFKAFMTGLLTPLTSALSSLGRSLSGYLFGGGPSGKSGILGNILGGGQGAAIKALGGIFGLGGATAALAAPSAASLSATMASMSALGIGFPAAGVVAAPAAAATGLTGALGLGGGAGLLGLGAATIPVIGGVVAAALLANHFIGQGRKSANEFVQQTENPFGNSLSALVDQFNSAKEAGTLSLADAKQARAATSQLWSDFLAANKQFASQGKTQAKVAQQSLDHMTEIFGPSLSKVFGSMDSAIKELGGGSGIPATGGATSATTRFAAAVDKIVPALTTLADSILSIVPRGTSAITITNDFAPQFTFYGVPESLQKEIRDTIEPQIVSDLQDNSRGITEKIKAALGL